MALWQNGHNGKLAKWRNGMMAKRQNAKICSIVLAIKSV
jgi:hypothetical protein